MIKLSEIAEVGHFNKPHGIKGEISASFDIDIDINEIKCLIIDVDGIFVPFFPVSIRPKTSDTCLLTIDGIDTEEKAQSFTNRSFYVLRSDLPYNDDIDEPDGLYASDLIGFKVIDANYGDIGIISDINDSTQNILFIIHSSDNREILIPVVDEFIESIDTENKVLNTDIPLDIISLNS